MFDPIWLIAFAIGYLFIEVAGRHIAPLTPILLGAALLLAVMVITVLHHQALTSISPDFTPHELALFSIAAGR
ncbi:hypothetical protein [Methylobacterium oxalidis]|uniref:hypothetical protein n=1 Tax=Methylobacterium oxalidis TaxID=944322 RepID=UPI003314E303